MSQREMHQTTKEQNTFRDIKGKTYKTKRLKTDTRDTQITSEIQSTASTKKHKDKIERHKC